MSAEFGRRLVANTGALAGANLWRIVVSFLLQLVIARRLGLESLGAYTVAMAYLNVSQVLCELGLPLWMVREVAHRPTARRAYFRRALWLLGGMALALWGGLLLLALWLPYPPELRQAIGWVGASLPFYAVSAAAAIVFQAGERLPLLLRVEVVTNSLILAASLVVVWAAGTVADLLLVVVVAQIISATVSLGWLARSRLLAPPQENTPPPWTQLRREVAPFFGLSLADVLLQRLDILLLSLLADVRLLGLYSAAYNLVRVAVKLAQSYWRGLYPTLSRLHHQAPMQGRAVAHTALRYLLLLGCGGAAVSSGVAREILHLVYGSRDAEAARLLAWLVWSVPLFGLELYASTRLLVEGRARAALLLSLAHVAALALFLLPAARQAGALGAAGAVLAAQALGTVGGLWLLGDRLAPAVRVHLLLLGMLTLGAGVAAWAVPGPAWLRAGLALALYVAGLGRSGWLTAQDRARFLSLLRRSGG